MDSTFFSVVPNNSLGKSAVRWLRSNDVHCTPMILTEPDETPSNRLGTYYLETGYGIRASKVIYDRKHSAITEYDFSQVDLDALLEGYDWLHLSGITPAPVSYTHLDVYKRQHLRHTYSKSLPDPPHGAPWRSFPEWSAPWP